MQLYLVQHGLAMSEEQDPARPLTDEGRAAVRRSARLASRLGVRVAEIRHSDKLRAAQTAEELAQVLDGTRKQAPGLAPNDDVHPAAREMASYNGNLMIVGHQPFLGRLAALLVCQNESLPVIRFQNAGIVRLDRNEDGRWSLVWILPPEALP